jgi:A/G-specific adenine glycosylase
MEALAGKTMSLSEHSKSELQECLLIWFEQAHRDFPWRSQSDPYAILIAEKLLQQTAARDVVIQAYKQILGRYPTPRHLADADISDIQAIIRPLGLKYRSKELKAMAQELVAHHNGEVPRDLGKLIALPGIGEYSARAVLSFAFQEDTPVVDTNVARFLYRVYGLPGPLPANPARKKSLIKLAGALVPPGRSKEFNLAILDLCAQICRPSNPICSDCPVRAYCAYVTEKGVLRCL